MEILDIYNASKERTNKSFVRGDRLNKGEYYLITEIWTVNRNGKILITLRDPCKKSEPDKWENTGGAVRSGESSIEAAVRELYEETGIVAGEEELIYLGTSQEESLFADIYMLIRDVKLCDLKLQQGETISAKLVYYEELTEMIKNGEFAQTIAKRLYTVLDSFLKYMKC